MAVPGFFSSTALLRNLSLFHVKFVCLYSILIYFVCQLQGIVLLYRTQRREEASASMSLLAGFLILTASPLLLGNPSHYQYLYKVEIFCFSKYKICCKMSIFCIFLIFIVYQIPGVDFSTITVTILQENTYGGIGLKP